MTSAFRPSHLEGAEIDAARADRLALDSHQPLSIGQSDQAFLVARGHVDLFAVMPVGDGSPPRRWHLLRVAGGGLILGLPASAHAARRLEIVAIGGADTEVIPCSRGDITDRTMLEEWSALLLATVATLPDNVAATHVDVSVTSELAGGETLRMSGRQVGWISIEEGAVRVIGLQQAITPLDPPSPLSPGTWLVAEAPTKLRVRDGASLALAEMQAGIDTLHRLVVAELARKFDNEWAADMARLERRAVEQESRAETAMGRLVGLVDPDAVPPEDLADRGDRVLLACRAVADALGVELAPGVKRLPGADDLTTVLKLAEASGLRSRRLLLRADWWTNSAGPFIAFLGEERRAVVILPGYRGGHLLVDPTSGTRKPLTGNMIADLAPEAVMFYPSLPARSLALRDLVFLVAPLARADLSRIVMAAVGLGLLAMAAPMVTKVLVDSVLPRAEADQLLVCAAALLVVTLVSAGFQFMQGAAVQRLESRFDWMMQAAIADRLLRMPLAFFRSYSAGDLADRALGIEAIRAIVTSRSIRALLALASFVFGFSVMLYLDAPLGLFAAALVLVRLAVIAGFSYARLKHERASFGHRGWLGGAIVQFVTGIAKLRIANATTNALNVWVERFSLHKRHFMASQRAANALRSIEAGFPAVATLLIFAGSEQLAANSPMHELGTFLAFYAAFGIALGSVGEWGQAVAQFVTVIPRIERLRPILATPIEVSEDATAPGEIEGAIEFADVSFRYGSAGPPVLDGISLSVARGEYVAIVGPSGSGKSTLFRLLLGFEKPHSGVIFVDGKSIETIDLSSLRRQVGVVLQNSKLSSGNLYENICGGIHLPIDRVWDIARSAGLDRDIEAMPMGMHTFVAEGINTLSGGQRQRLLIARALAHNPRLLLMDEATSALDNRSQAIVTASIERLNITRIVIAHRLSTVQSADRIVVLDKGRIVQSGSFDELMGKPGLFAEFARRQLLQED
ncbi:NHLP bacteriocin export ABC transporter permease/ATPase subunit [uncultured Bradyrhizobium sp.]|jgi:NHLM bacteriocin system ABC transporter ATP-binding protein|uniref:NHLP bacteriocin export ABC transporter permease/ATPase subunit n=1 Tax=uncultured Bradyrhizobium sp. TaxID=199684 RepID=UPI00262FB39C|nr:NHLP bacteriocin export ABC transporter permease/ATPase subunit [uncultured Bradyrhizobium sp.]